MDTLNEFNEYLLMTTRKCALIGIKTVFLYIYTALEMGNATGNIYCNACEDSLFLKDLQDHDKLELHRQKCYPYRSVKQLLYFGPECPFHDGMPLVGFERILEVTNGRSKYYMCTLCERPTRFERKDILAHLGTHYLCFLNANFPTAYTIWTQMNLLSQNNVETIIRHLEYKFGHGIMKSVTQKEFIADWNDIMNEVSSKVHFNEKDYPECVNDIFTLLNVDNPLPATLIDDQSAARLQAYENLLVYTGGSTANICDTPAIKAAPSDYQASSYPLPVLQPEEPQNQVVKQLLGKAIRSPLKNDLSKLDEKIIERILKRLQDDDIDFGCYVMQRIVQLEKFFRKFSNDKSIYYKFYALMEYVKKMPEFNSSQSPLPPIDESDDSEYEDDDDGKFSDVEMF